ncbi:DUF4136 domain-containing protein [Pontibacter sp. CAU 1760]
MSLLTMVGCVAASSVMQATAIKAPYATPSAYKTYAWYQPAPVATADFVKPYSTKLNENIRKAVEAELQEQGYRKVEQQPDVLVAYDVSVSVSEEQEQKAKPAQGFGYSYGYMAGYRYKYGHVDMPGYRSVDLFKQGTLIIDLIHPKSNMLLWRGWAEGGIRNPKAGYSPVQQQVEEILGNL